MAAVVPETAPFVRAAITTEPGLKNIPAPVTNVAMQMQCLVYEPFRSAAERCPMGTLRGSPFLILMDGLDECDDKEEIQELIEGMLAFFDDNPFIPLRVFITSRVEQHIQPHLNVPGVRLENLVDHCSDDDISTFLDVLFESERRRNPVIRAYISEHGEWPIPGDKQKLVKHIGGSFIFASSVFKFIMGSTVQAGSLTTPMDRLPLALEMNPGLDGLYAQTLARSEHLPYFLDIISTIALLEAPLPTSGIAELLGISTHEVVNVLVNLQAIIQVPGTDNMPVTLFHTSLRDFLTTQGRSGQFFASPRHHVHLFFRLQECELKLRRQKLGGPMLLSECTPAAAYSLRFLMKHLIQGEGLFQQTEIDSAIQLCRVALKLHPDDPELIYSLAGVTYSRARYTGSLVDLEEAVSLYREVLKLHPWPHPDRSSSLHNLSTALLDRYRHTPGIIANLEEIISLYRDALELRPPPHPARSSSLNNLASALQDRHRSTGTMDDLEEAIFLYREALELRPSPDPERSPSLNNLGNALLDRYRRTDSITDLEESISLHYEALGLRPSPHRHRALSLSNLSISLHDMYKATRALPHLQAAILYCEELLAFHYPVGHQYRPKTLNHLTSLLQMRFHATGREDLARIEAPKGEASRLSALSATADTDCG
ncbi:hypothetical protein H1R20_g605, partial [Candolleomyces eurysporus]